jgi:hypothetical protein
VSLWPGVVLPKDMDARGFAEWCRKQLAAPQQDVTSVTPSWTGFSVAPSGNLLRIDLGAAILLYPEGGFFSGTSSGGSMAMTHGVSGLQTPVYAAVAVFDDDGEAIGQAKVVSGLPNFIQFAFPTLSVPGTSAKTGMDTSGFKTSGSKGWRGVIVFPKSPLRVSGGSNA